jgi:hypothetical protein
MKRWNERRANALAALLLATGIGGAALAAGDEREKALTPRAIEKIGGEEVKKAVEKVLTLHWHTDLSHALATAREEGKPVFWLQLVGNLGDGL